MRVLYVVSGNHGSAPGAVVSNQAKSLEKAGHEIDFFLVKGKGIRGYLGNYRQLRKTAAQGDYDIIHGHGFSSLLVGLLPQRNVVASLLGSEVFENTRLKSIYRYFIANRWKATIVKSERILQEFTEHRNRKEDRVALAPYLHIIPNGVDLERFRPMDKNDAQSYLVKHDSSDLTSNRPIILFMANPNRTSKNVELAKASVELLEDAELKIIHGVDPERVPYYLNAVDVVLLTSRWEGSPNIVKEAMACNRPVVSTNVGDIQWLIGGLQGYYIAKPTREDVADKIQRALGFKESAEGRQRIIELGLDDDSITGQISKIYEDVARG